MTTVAAVLIMLAWTIGPTAFTVGLVIWIVGLCTDVDEKPKARKYRIRLSLMIMGISTAAMLLVTIFAMFISLLGF